MKKLAVFLVIFLSLSFLNPVLTLAEGKTASAGTGKTPLLQRASDWFATLGKTQEEKEDILEERQDKRMLQEISQSACGLKEDLGSELLNAKTKAAEEIAQAKEKVSVIMQRAKQESDKVMVQARERAIKIVEAAKEKAGTQMSGYKQQLKKQANSALDKAKEFINK